MAGRDHWVIWTSRPAPLREGLRQLHLQGSARRFPTPGEIEIDASRLSISEKAQMLYRHAKAATLSPEAVGIVRRFARQIVESAHFTPLRISRFVRDQLPNLLVVAPEERESRVRSLVAQSLQVPTRDMATSYSVLNEERRAALIVLLNSATGGVTLDGFASQIESYLGHPLNTSAELIIDSIDGHFIRLHE